MPEASIPSLVNGVSRQAPAQRLLSQAETQINFISDPAKGLLSRNGTELIAVIGDFNLDGDCLAHFIERDNNERYMLLLRDSTLNVYDLFTGQQNTVTTDSGVLAYLNTTDPENDFAALTVDDTTWIVNRSVTVAAAGSVEAAPTSTIVYIKRGLKTTTYSLTFHVPGKNVTLNHTTAAQSAGTASEISSIDIAKDIRDKIAESSAETDPELVDIRNNFYVDLYGSTLRFRPKNSSSYFVSCNDSYSDQATVAFTDSYKNYEDLPQHCFDGVKLEITNNAKDESSHYFLEYTTNSGHNIGRWKEAAGWGLQHEVDTSTFPVKLVRQSDGTFHLSRCDLEPRVAGDSDTAPEPHFIGRKIRGLCFHANRLGVICQNYITWSRDDDYYRFYPKTVRQALDDDTFEQTTVLEGLCDIKFTLPFSRSLLVFGANQQYQISSDGAFTPTLAVIEPTTANDCSAIAAPVRAGASAYFVSPSGSYSDINEYYVMADEVANQANRITEHVDDFLPPNVFSLTARSSDNMLSMLTKDFRDRIYIYSYIWMGNEKGQSSWSYFELPAGSEIIRIKFISDKLYLLLQRNKQTRLERIDFGSADSIEANPYIDSRVRTTGIYDPESDTTTFSLPYSVEDAEVCVTCAEDAATAGRTLNVVEATGRDIKVEGDYSSGSIYAGFSYESIYEFSEQYLRNKYKENQAITGKRTQIQRFQIDYADSGDFTARVISKGVTRDRKKSGLMSRGGFVVNKPKIDSGTFKFPVNAQNTGTRIQLVAKSPYPVSFQSASWEGWLSEYS